MYNLLSLIEACPEENVDLDDFCMLPGGSEVKQLATYGILLSTKQKRPKNAHKELQLSINTQTLCNLRCKYCYSPSHMDNEVLDSKSISAIFSYFDSQFNFDFCRVDFVGGGEPLINFEKFRALVVQIENELKKRKKKYLFWVCTNGTLLTNEIISFLDSYRFNVGVSIDGPQPIHDANRIDIEGNGTYEIVSENVKMILNNFNLTRNIRDLWCCSVISESTQSLVDILQHTYKLGFRNLQMKLLWGSGSKLDEMKDRLCKMYTDLSIYLSRLIERKQLEQFICICNQNDFYGRILLRLILQSATSEHCNAGKNKFSVNYDGKIYPCDSFMSNRLACIGDVECGMNELYHSFSKYNVGTNKICRNCWAQYICGGPCCFDMFISGKYNKVPTTALCDITKHIIEECVSLIVNAYSKHEIEMKTIFSILSKRMLRLQKY